MGYKPLMKYNLKYAFKRDFVQFAVIMAFILAVNIFLPLIFPKVVKGVSGAYQMALLFFCAVNSIGVSYENFQLTTANSVSRKSMSLGILTENFLVYTSFSAFTVLCEVLHKLIYENVTDKASNIDFFLANLNLPENFTLRVLALFGALVCAQALIGYVIITFYALVLRLGNVAGMIFAILICGLSGGAGGYLFGSLFKGAEETASDRITISPLIMIAAVCLTAVLIIVSTLILKRVPFDRAAVQKGYNNK